MNVQSGPGIAAMCQSFARVPLTLLGICAPTPIAEESDLIGPHKGSLSATKWRLVF